MTFQLDDLYAGLTNMPFFPNELAYLSVSGKCEDTLRDRLAYYLANESHQQKNWDIFHPKEVPINMGYVDLAVFSEEHSPITRIKALIEMKHLISTEVLYGNEFTGRYGNNGRIKRVLSDIEFLLESIQNGSLSIHPIRLYQIIFVSHYIPSAGYDTLPDRSRGTVLIKCSSVSSYSGYKN